MKVPAIAREIVIQNRLGLHARAAAQFVKTAGRFKAEITVESDRQGTTLKLCASGEDGSAALQALADLVEARFGERE